MLKVCEYNLINVPKRIFNLVIAQRKLAEKKKATSKACFRTTEVFTRQVK